MSIHYPLASLGLVVLAGSCLAAYLFGYAAGMQRGQDEGREEGRESGKKEGAVRAFAVGYDRGRRERDEGEDPEADDRKLANRPSFVVFLFVAVTTVLLLSLYTSLRQRGLF